VKPILLVESDGGFLFWFGQGLAQAGYAVIPARSVPDAEALLGEPQIAVDLLIVNPALPYTAGFVETLSEPKSPPESRGGH
jgi:DNA-binding response OmpR family regulator